MRFDIRSMTHWRYLTAVFSILLTVAALLALGIRGLNWGMDFTGGVITEVKMDAQYSGPDLTSRLEQGLNQTVSLVQAGEPGRWLIRTGPVDPQASSDVTALSVLQQIDPDVQLIASSVVGAQVGQELAETGGVAVLFSMLAILFYLWYRFEWRLASGALLALLHDVIMVLGLFAVTQMEFNLTVLAAVLAVVGYSLNDSIVLSDRIRELLLAKPDWPLTRINDTAVKQTFARTMVTSGTTLTTVAAVWIFAGASLHGFAIALFVGIISGTWSSIAIGTVLPELAGLTPEHYRPEPIPDLP
ncbi:protein translocase subunit SecF [Ferrimonas balearica]|uniref:protein translocase subunit SecF n=1 Tax=Ferrimonas balearica TaxID=44012 RepID=UPI001F33FE50|nr:protein translocase subunit SecF [Ferrimonas balearica]MBY6094894.1 protein translocase subunit SecF [Ferrimonas balearica]